MTAPATTGRTGLRQNLVEKLVGRVAIVGVGSRDHGDDAAGPVVAQSLIDAGVPYVIDAGSSPELETWRLREMGPRTVLFVDAVDFGGQPGDVALLGPADMRSDGCDTHRAPLKLTMLYLHGELECQSYVLAIQPSCVRSGTRLCESVAGSAAQVAEMLAEVLAGRG